MGIAEQQPRKSFLEVFTEMRISRTRTFTSALYSHSIAVIVEPLFVLFVFAVAIGQVSINVSVLSSNMRNEKMFNVNEV